jgi:hypothetical protein
LYCRTLPRSQFMKMDWRRIFASITFSKRRANGTHEGGIGGRRHRPRILWRMTRPGSGLDSPEAYGDGCPWPRPAPRRASPRPS